MVPNAQKHILRVSLIALLCSASTMAVGAAIVEQPLDKRVTSTMTFDQLVELDPWQKGYPPTDPTKQMYFCRSGIGNTPGGFNAERAQNLACAKHFAEALGEWTRAIDSYDEETSQRYRMTLSPKWLISRARLLLKLGREADALQDIERSIKLNRQSDQARFSAALLLTELGMFAQAEESLRDDFSFRLFKPYRRYLLAVLQEKQGKKELAKVNFRDAATQFAAAGMAPPVEACLEAFCRNSGNQKLTIADLKPPKSNYANMERLIKSLATRSDVFDLNVLKELIGATAFKERGGEYFVTPYKGQFPEIRLARVVNLKSGGKKIDLSFESTSCCLSRDPLRAFLTKPTAVPEPYRKDLIRVEGYKVPAGTLVLNIGNGGFKPITAAQLYSKDAIFPETSDKATNVKPPPETAKGSREFSVLQALQNGNLDFAETEITQWLSESPTDPRALMCQADIFHRRRNFDAALSTIENAIKYSASNESLKNKYTGNILLIKKGTYQLDKGEFENAYRSFDEGFPAKPSGEQLYLRGRAEIGLNKFEDAYVDLSAASKQFYDASSIERRDEVEKLLDSISPKVNPDRLDVHPRRLIGARIGEGDQTSEIISEVRTEKLQRDAVKTAREQQVLEKTVRTFLLSLPRNDQKSTDNILALLGMARTAKTMGQQQTTKDYIDKAIARYQQFIPSEDYDPCTRPLIDMLREFQGTEFQTRLETVANRSELFCKDQSFRSERDRSFLSLCKSGNSKIAMLEKLIEIRKLHQHETGIDSGSLQEQLSKESNGKSLIEDYRHFSKDRFIHRTDAAISNEFLIAALAAKAVEEILALIAAKRFDECGTRIAALEQRSSNNPCSASFCKTVIQAQYLAIAEGFLQQKELSSADKYFRKSLSTRLCTKNEVLPFVNFLWDLRKAYEDTRNYKEAEALYEYALTEFAKGVNLRPETIVDTKVNFAELLLAHSRNTNSKIEAMVLRKRATRIFEECLPEPEQERHLKHRMEMTRLRQLIASDYPALAQLDLAGGNVEYEDEGTRSGSQSGGITINSKVIRAVGPHSIEITMGREGRQSILLDGKTFSEKALLSFEAKKYDEAEKLLVAALRSDPDAESFYLLGECWFAQKKFEQSLQAASVALEIDKVCPKAISLKHRCQAALKRRS